MHYRYDTSHENTISRDIHPKHNQSRDYNVWDMTRHQRLVTQINLRRVREWDITHDHDVLPDVTRKLVVNINAGTFIKVFVFPKVAFSHAVGFQQGLVYKSCYFIVE